MTLRFDVDSFEQIPAGPDTVLLRIAGRWVGPARERLPTPLLLIDDGRRSHRVSPLPGPEDSPPLAGPEGPPWRAAFSAPAEMVAGAHVAFALDAGRGVIADLPRPAGGAVASAAAAAPPPVPQPEPAPVPGTSAVSRGFLRGRRDDPSARPPAPPRAVVRELEELRASADAERAAREDAERRAADAQALAERAAADAARATELASRAEAARIGAIDALADERLRASERAVAEEERERERREQTAQAADQARRAAVVAHEAQRALQEAQERIAVLEQGLAEAREQTAALSRELEALRAAQAAPPAAGQGEGPSAGTGLTPMVAGGGAAAEPLVLRATIHRERVAVVTLFALAAAAGAALFASAVANLLP